jgi:hypothetical protein
VPFHLYMFKNNNPISNSQDIKCFMTGEDWGIPEVRTYPIAPWENWYGVMGDTGYL